MNTCPYCGEPMPLPEPETGETFPAGSPCDDCCRRGVGWKPANEQEFARQTEATLQSIGNYDDRDQT